MVGVSVDLGKDRAPPHLPFTNAHGPSDLGTAKRSSHLCLIEGVSSDRDDLAYVIRLCTGHT